MNATGKDSSEGGSECNSKCGSNGDSVGRQQGHHRGRGAIRQVRARATTRVAVGATTRDAGTALVTGDSRSSRDDDGRMKRASSVAAMAKRWLTKGGGKEGDRRGEKKVSTKTEGRCWRRCTRHVAAAAKVRRSALLVLVG